MRSVEFQLNQGLLHVFQASHDEKSRSVVMGTRRRRRDDGGSTSRRRGQRGRRLSASDATSWLATLQSVSDEYRRAEAAARAEAERETVRLRRAERADARATAASLLDAERRRSAATEQAERRALTSSLERRDGARRQALLLSLLRFVCQFRHLGVRSSITWRVV